MPYKGGDLNLRLAGPALSREAPAPAPRGGGAHWEWPAAGAQHPVAVDEVVLACCNTAYDIAHFHGSGEVRLEHLLHALTRIAPAAQVLAELGIRADILRRDTAVAIAADPSTHAIGAGVAPRASAALDDALRRAAGEAERRLQPVSVPDVVRALVDGGPDSPAATLLMRAAADPHRLERWRDEARRQALVSATPQPQAGVVSGAAADALVERLDRMEASLQALREDVATERRVAADLLRAIQAELQAFRAEGAQTPSAGSSEAVDAVLEAKLGKFGEAMAALAARLGAIDKLADGDRWQTLEARLTAVESGIAAQASAMTEGFSGAMRTRLQAAEDAGNVSERRHGEIRQAMTSLDASQQMLADNLATWRVESGADIAIVSNRLQQLEQKALDLLDRLGDEVGALRQGHVGDEVHRSNGFKRWLYGTGSVFASGTRAEDAGHALGRRRPDEKS
jgi:hypothetical protein